MQSECRFESQNEPANLKIPALASRITKAASKQTYYTIRILVDRERVGDAYRAYGYFRWVDDTLDGSSCSGSERRAFLERQKNLLAECYRGRSLADLCAEEMLLAELVQRNSEKNSGLCVYLHNMLRVMDFDARRRGRLISQDELDRYTFWLASAVTEAMHYFIGLGEFAPHDNTRYLAVSAAHMTHMLRDMWDDVQAGYYNIPREALWGNKLALQDLQSDTCRLWVKSRVQLAHQYFRTGKGYLARVQNLRCRLAGFAYTARFEWLLDMVERDGYFLRPGYAESKQVRAGLRMAWLLLSYLFNLHAVGALSRPVASHSLAER